MAKEARTRMTPTYSSMTNWWKKSSKSKRNKKKKSEEMKASKRRWISKQFSKSVNRSKVFLACRIER